MAQTIEQKRETSRRCMAKRRAEHPEESKEYQRKYRRKNLERVLAHEQANRDKHREEHRARSRAYRAAHIDERKAYNRKWQERLRSAIFTFYGGSDPHCECCGERHNDFLTIDHIGGGGNKHRREIGGGALYSWLIKNNFPKGFRILCMNCNWATRNGAPCPHEMLTTTPGITYTYIAKPDDQKTYTGDTVQ